MNYKLAEILPWQHLVLVELPGEKFPTTDPPCYYRPGDGSEALDYRLSRRLVIHAGGRRLAAGERPERQAGRPLPQGAARP
jgi:hypothetical protein